MGSSVGSECGVDGGTLEEEGEEEEEEVKEKREQEQEQEQGQDRGDTDTERKNVGIETHAHPHQEMVNRRAMQRGKADTCARHSNISRHTYQFAQMNITQKEEFQRQCQRDLEIALVPKIGVALGHQVTGLHQAAIDPHSEQTQKLQPKSCVNVLSLFQSYVGWFEEAGRRGGGKGGGGGEGERRGEETRGGGEGRGDEWTLLIEYCSEGQERQDVGGERQVCAGELAAEISRQMRDQHSVLRSNGEF